MQSSTADPGKLAYSIKEACRASSLGRTTLYSHIASGRLLSKRIGGRTIIPAESLHALIAGEG
ncbi:MAG: helix-turn-helix domain-containing protein [Novosphingobium sp.]